MPKNTPKTHAPTLYYGRTVYTDEEAPDGVLVFENLYYDPAKAYAAAVEAGLRYEGYGDARALKFPPYQNAHARGHTLAKVKRSLGDGCSITVIVRPAAIVDAPESQPESAHDLANRIHKLGCVCVVFTADDVAQTLYTSPDDDTATPAMVKQASGWIAKNGDRLEELLIAEGWERIGIIGK